MRKYSREILEKRYEEIREKRDDLLNEVYNLRKAQKVNVKYIQKLEKELFEYKLLLHEELKWRLENEKVSDKRKET